MCGGGGFPGFFFKKRRDIKSGGFLSYMIGLGRDDQFSRGMDLHLILLRPSNIPPCPPPSLPLPPRVSLNHTTQPNLTAIKMLGCFPPSATPSGHPVRLSPKVHDLSTPPPVHGALLLRLWISQDRDVPQRPLARPTAPSAPRGPSQNVVSCFYDHFLLFPLICII